MDAHTISTSGHAPGGRIFARKSIASSLTFSMARGPSIKVQGTHRPRDDLLPRPDTHGLVDGILLHKKQ
jgi:hypothetical protein